MTDLIATSPPAVRRFSKVVALMTFFLLFAGAMVTSTNSGLAVPDWPLSYGKLNPPMVGGIFYEHGHRMIASLVGFLTVVQAILLQRREPKRFLRRLGWTAVAVVILQGLFGGLTVLLRLRVWTSVTHAALAELFLCLNVAIAFFASKTFSHLRRDERFAAPGRGFSWLLVSVVYVQILLGAIMRHRGAGLAISDFPLSFGHLVPPADTINRQVAIAFSHRVGAAVVTLLVLIGAWGALRCSGAIRRVWGALLLVLVAQITLGAYTIWTLKQPVVTSFHVLTGALLLATSLVATLVGEAVRVRDRSPALLGRDEVTA